MTFGAYLRSLRTAAGLTQEELAHRAGLTANGVSALERGARTHPYPHTLRSLVDALALTEDERTALMSLASDGSAGEAPSSTTTPETKLPVALTELVGREDEVVELVGMLSRPDIRLVTLTGPGGVGKTRLAVEAGRRAVAQFPDGVAFAALAPLSDPSLVLPTLATSVGAPDSDGLVSVSAVAAHLGSRRVLLVLDNFEHLMEAAPAITDLITAAPQLTVLVTSRARLRLRGETDYPVEPLGLPASTRSPTPEQVELSAAGQLFMNRARAADPGFVSTQETAADIAAICWRLGGLPLGIELAAAKVRVLTPQDLLDRLDEALATGWARDLPARQRTLRATLDWSYGLLTDEQRLLLRRLSIFAGGFSLDAVEALAAEVVEHRSALDLLEALIEHSLVVVVRDPGGPTYYTMLEPIRQYARELLRDSGQEAEACRAHAAYFLRRAERAVPEYKGPDQVQWLERTQWESDNMRAAMLWALSAGQSESAARLGWALWLLWWMRGQLREGRAWMEVALADEMPAVPRTRALLVHACMCYAQGDLDAARGSWEAALENAVGSDDVAGQAYALAGTGLVAMVSDATLAASRLQAAIELAERVQEEWLTSLATIWFGTLLLVGGDPEAAKPMFEQASTSAHVRGDRLVICVALFNLAQTAIVQGDLVTADRHLQESVQMSTQTRDTANLAFALELLAVVEAQRRDWRRSTVLMGAGRALRAALAGPVYNYYLPDEELRARSEGEAEAELGAGSFHEAWLDGQAMTFDAAAEYAVADRADLRP